MNDSSFDFEKAIDFVRKKTKDVEKYKLHFILDEKKEAKSMLKEQLKMQNEDGGIPYRFQQGAISTIGSTIMFFKDLLLLNLHELISEELDKAVEFLIGRQHEDGLFEEPPEINKLECAMWESTGFESNQIYCTAIAINFLLGSKKTQAEDSIIKGMDFLLKKWDNEKGFRSYPHALWNSIPVFISKKSEDDPISARGRELLNTLQLQNYPSSSLVWMIESFIHTGLEKHNLVEKLLQIILPRQMGDGRWTSEDGEEFDPLTTLSVLVILKRLNLLSK